MLSIDTFTRFSHGCEHELADIPAIEVESLGEGFKRDEKDVTVVNSNGIANDPTLKLYGFGGEINTPPTNTISMQCYFLDVITQKMPTAAVNYRSNLHWHIGLPEYTELSDRAKLFLLKKITRFNAYWLPIILPIIEPIPEPNPDDFLSEKAYRGARRRYRRRKRSHHTILSESRVKNQLAATNLTEFFEAEVPRSGGGKPMWHAQARAAMNIRQLLQTGTFEFRHFPGTLDIRKLAAVGLWCTCYMLCALENWVDPKECSPLERFKAEGGRVEGLPEFPSYNHALEIRYRATCHDGKLPKDQIAKNIEAILEDAFDEAYWQDQFVW